MRSHGAKAIQPRSWAPVKIDIEEDRSNVLEKLEWPMDENPGYNVGHYKEIK